MFGRSRPRSTFEMEPSKPYFVSQSLFWQETYYAPICGRNSFSPSAGIHFFFWSPLFKIWDWALSPQQKREGGGGGGLTLWCHYCGNIIKPNFERIWIIFSIYYYFWFNMQWVAVLGWPFKQRKASQRS